MVGDYSAWEIEIDRGEKNGNSVLPFTLQSGILTLYHTIKSFTALEKAHFVNIVGKRGKNAGYHGVSHPD